ncbi:LuxR family transcriptional regulator [Catenulispora sp. NF23]|uniref:helix-turn-helix domain-containing protein n=1 Tax=Catenulispora pinistramenti TaxID=2705254 RepID=UPI001BAD5C2C|nr:helix-turn-helix domain-containing protein [Catenulispora pinistramenti]MBS2533036.1 LuxR family transcriptional regulator [Catenulispora pinistramenti]
MLQGLGLDAASEQVYRALLAEPALEYAALAESSGLTQAQIGAALDRLADLALLRKSRQNPDRWHPVSLERGVAALLRRQEAELAARREALLAGQAAAVAFNESVTRRRSQMPGGVEQITALDDIQTLMESLLYAADNEVCSIVPNVMPAEALQASRPLDEDLTARGVRLRIVCHEAIRSNATALAYERAMLALGAQVRTAAAVPIRLLIVDRTSAVVPFDPESRETGAILTTAPGMVRALCELFDRLWDGAAPLEPTPPSDAATGLTDSEAELLKLLSGGLTDEAAAKRLGVSVRTVKRRMEDLMRRLEAGSRFEAGARAAKRGWL